MPRARSIKPAFFTDEDLVELSFEIRLLFIGLWTLADRAGRLEDKPKQIKMAIFPADNVDVEQGVSELHHAALVQRYVVGNKAYIQITNFTKHQHPHINERESTLPAPEPHGANPSGLCNLVSVTHNPTPESGASTVQAPEKPEKEIYTASVQTQMQKKLGLEKLPGHIEWMHQIEWAFLNKFTEAEFLECYDLLTQQKWRDGPVSAKHIPQHLPILDKLRTEIRNQNGSTSSEPPLTEEQKEEMFNNQGYTDRPRPTIKFE